MNSSPATSARFFVTVKSQRECVRAAVDRRRRRVHQQPRVRDPADAHGREPEPPRVASRAWCRRCRPASRSGSCSPCACCGRPRRSGSRRAASRRFPCTNWKCTGSLLFSCMSCMCTGTSSSQAARLGPVRMRELGHLGHLPVGRLALGVVPDEDQLVALDHLPRAHARERRDPLAVGDLDAAAVCRRTASRGTGSGGSRRPRGRPRARCAPRCGQ